MGRGISQQQKQILGLAYTVNKFTQGGIASVKGGDPVPNYKLPTVDYIGYKDLKTSLAIYALKNILPRNDIQAGIFRGTKQYKSAKASITRAMTRLMERGLLIYAPNANKATHRWGYVLTQEGMEIGKDNEVLVIELESALCLFSIRPCDLYFEWAKGQYGGGHVWNFYRSEQHKELINKLRDAHAVTAEFKQVENF